MNPVVNGKKKPNDAFPFVETEQKQEPKILFAVFRKRWLWGEKFFCICEEVMEYENIFLLKTENQVIAIIPRESFSCAIKHEPEV